MPNVPGLPNAVVLVSIIINTCDSHTTHAQRERTKQYQKLIPGIVRRRRQKGEHVVAVDFSRWEEAGRNLLRDCVHPTDDAYGLMGDWWYSFLTQVDEAWIQEPQGNDPDRAVNWIGVKTETSEVYFHRNVFKEI
ncbi:SGNH-hydro domain-containing protein [Fusarium sp. Ph1]|nr:SGNH-hydro domain-containing protein [Fusarium sp. Ph1]